MEKLYIIDAMNFLFRSYYAIGPMTNPKGESTNALYGFIRSINKIIKDFSPEHLVAVFDGFESKKQRTAIYSEYKSHRKKMPEDLVPQLEKALEFCEIARIPCLSVSGVEADDTIGSIARWAEKHHAKTFICTSDKDMCQLVSDDIFVINPHKDNLLIDRNKVIELFGVAPEQITDLLGIVGDASDNIPGLEGFGPKTAVSLIQEFGSMENILAHPEKIKGEKKQQTLIDGKEIALMSKQLATIQTDVDFPMDNLFFKLIQPDLERLKQLYHDMHFMSLLKDLDSTYATETVVPESKEEHVDYILVDDDKSLNDLIETLTREKEICLDTETTDIRPMKARLVGISFCVHPKQAWYIPVNGQLEKSIVINRIKPLLENPRIGFFGHNIKYDYHVLRNEGITIANICFDTILASYLLDPQNPRHNLDQLTLEKFGKVKTPIESLIGKGKKQISMMEVPVQNVCDYCCEDVDYTCRLKNLFQKNLEKEELISLLRELEIPLIPVLAMMERKGIYIDVNALKTLSQDLKYQIKGLQEHIFHLAGETFNLNSPKQLSGILFEKMQIKPPKKTMTGFSTSAEVLESLKEDVAIVKEIILYRTLEKLRSTYVDSLPEQVLPETHRIHCTFNQSVAATGRLSCQNPNLQNIPVRTREGNKIREAFKPELPHWCFLAADYSQIELRLLAHLSEDPALLKAFNEGEDIHAYTASLVFDVPLKEVSPEMRNRAKAVNFGILYGQQAFGLSQQLAIEFKEASDFIETYFQRYKKVKEFLNFCKESVRKTGR
ncbi:MAG TPA: DNA polymerase I, partial [Rhabdochlamydiaceae bacterium]|nr:DNA polymerase I [Rhabdochlamydiaceae bacterium]